MQARALLAMSCVATALVAAPHAARAETYTGADFTTLARQSIDVLRMQHYRLQGQMQRDESEFAYEAVLRSMAAKFQRNDGRVATGHLERIGGGYWFGTGQPRSGTAFFSAAQMDAGIAAMGASDAIVWDGLLLAGVAHEGLSLAVGVRGGFTSGMTADGQFAAGETGISYRPGAPNNAIPQPEGESVTRFRFGGFVTSVQHAEGVSVGAVLDRTLGGEGFLAAVLALAQPAELMERLKARDFGVPGIGLNRISSEIDYYGDRLEQTRAQVAQGLPAPPRKLSAPLYEVPVVIDDLAAIGIRVKGVVQASPEPLFRLGELGYSLRGSAVRAGGRAIAFRRGEVYVGSGEAFAGVGTSHSSESSGWSATVSYSYNVPDSVTFYAIPNAMVWGLQFTVGPEELARPIIPLVTRKGAAK